MRWHLFALFFLVPSAAALTLLTEDGSSLSGFSAHVTLETDEQITYNRYEVCHHAEKLCI